MNHLHTEKSATVSSSQECANTAAEVADATPQYSANTNSEAIISTSSVSQPVAASPASPSKASKTAAPVKKPDNPLEAAMFLQMFPEEPKPIVKKSMAQMAAESSPKKSPNTAAVSSSTAADKSGSAAAEGL